MGALSALTLNLVFRLGIHRRASLVLQPGAIDNDRIEAFICNCGAAWGAPRDLMARVTYAAIQGAETISEVAEIKHGLLFEMAFDEFRV